MKRPDADQGLPRSHLFMVRLWREPHSDGHSEWRLRVQHVLSGERRHFRDWSALGHYLEQKLQELDAEQAP